VNKIKKLLTVFVLLINIMVFSDQDSIANAIEELDEIFALYQNNKGVDFREAVDRVLKKNTPVGFEHISCQSVELNLRGKLKEKSFGEWLNDVLSFLEIEKELRRKNGQDVDFISKIGVGIITKLDLSDNELVDLPEELNQLINLDELRIDNNRLKCLDLPDLPYLKILDVSYNQLEWIDERIQLSELEHLYLRCNPMLFINNSRKDVFRLISEKALRLQLIDLSENELDSINGLEYLLSSLTQVGLSENNLKYMIDVAKIIGDKELDALDLSGNKFKDYKGLGSLIGVAQLCLNDCGIKSFYDLAGLEQLQQLITLSLDNNEISQFDGMPFLSNLFNLTLECNEISSLKNMPELDQISNLNLKKNKLSTLHGLKSLPNIFDLDFSENNLTSKDEDFLKRNYPDLTFDNFVGKR